VTQSGDASQDFEGEQVVAQPDAWDNRKRADISYQLLVYSFADGNGDKVGDLPGLTRRLDYIDALGASAVWLSPIHPAASYHGYDVLDYEAVNPAFGSDADLRAFIDAAHARGIRVYLDYVLNHTGKDHPWFKSAAASEGSPYRDRYIFSEDPQADTGARRSGQTQQVTNSVSWSKDIFEMRLRQDSLRLQVGAQLDSLERSFNRIVVVAEHLPEISDKVLEELNRQATQLIWTMNASVDNAFADFDRQRGELQQYVTREREALVEQLRATGDELVRTTLDAVPGLVGKILLYVVLALAVLIGGPFALGFWLGGVRAKARIKNEKLKMKN